MVKDDPLLEEPRLRSLALVISAFGLTMMLDNTGRRETAILQSSFEE